ncbi:MAG: S41 family peptidase [Rhodospirillaceae bacterium]|jgi:carboxyl-terminal processing protease|nr:S41 family peptidase [Rhodospirillaceae bacterium]MBT3932536.1 S41 family peptidase [Rhodospirillaceae bacterium]MBT4772303.1 S41 family peptidase [Rhodospirillaceae bacterium]MBT5359590.1 S41 family peptidase [Rhodospirillaceae bacterium]MBT5768219.1 S41 family peptidase [Rhodospirillaceae bacterium]
MRNLITAFVFSAMLFIVPVAAIAADSDEETFRQLELFGDIFERVRSQYVDETEDGDLIEAAINGMLQSLDPHSSYLNEDGFRDMQVQTRGEFGGLGIEVTMEQGFVRVVSPIDETPAARAGIEAGDFITHLDGDTVLGLTLSEAVDKMRGRVGSDINLTIRREGRDPFDVAVTRDVVRIKSVRSRVEGKVGYVRITTFNEQTTTGLEAAMADVKSELGDDMIGLVLDLRRNPGGLLNEAVSVSDAFLERGEIVSQRGRSADDSQRFNAKKGDLANGLPMVVLINGGSASASEIVAGALQDHKRAVIMGTESFGKGSVQTIMPIPGHGAMRLTTAAYFTPSGRSVQKTGIMPDIIVEQARIETADTPERVRESDLRNARDNEGVESEDGAQSTETSAPEDYQLARAIDLLKGIATYNVRVTN